MAYCKNCGTEINDNALVCVNCGAVQNQNPNGDYGVNGQPAPADNNGFLWGLLGCCVPIVGLVLFLVWKDTKPKTAKAAGIGALVSVVISVVYYVLMLAIGIGFGIAVF